MVVANILLRMGYGGLLLARDLCCRRMRLREGAHHCDPRCELVLVLVLVAVEESFAVVGL